MPAEHDLDPPAMTEEERLAKLRYHAAFAFEMMRPPNSQSHDPQDLHPAHGENPSSEDETELGSPLSDD